MPSFSLSRCLCCFSNKQSAKATVALGLVQVQDEVEEEVGQPVPPSDELSGPGTVVITVEVNTELSQTPDKQTADKPEDQPTCQTANLLESEAQSESKPLVEAETVVAAAEETLKVTASGDDGRDQAPAPDAEAEDEEEYFSAEESVTEEEDNFQDAVSEVTKKKKAGAKNKKRVAFKKESLPEQIANNKDLVKYWVQR